MASNFHHNWDATLGLLVKLFDTPSYLCAAQANVVKMCLAMVDTSRPLPLIIFPGQRTILLFSKAILGAKYGNVKAKVYKHGQTSYNHPRRQIVATVEKPSD